MAGDQLSVNAFAGISSLNLASEPAGFKQHKFWESGLHSKFPLKGTDFRLVLVAMEIGAKMKEHPADGTIFIRALQRKLCVNVVEQAQDLQTGQILTLESEINHDAEAREDFGFLVTILCPGREKP
jgi:quercetin dioxygenase-like cupin family protein